MLGILREVGLVEFVGHDARCGWGISLHIYSSDSYPELRGHNLRLTRYEWGLVPHVAVRSMCT